MQFVINEKGASISENRYIAGINGEYTVTVCSIYKENDNTVNQSDGAALLAYIVQQKTDKVETYAIPEGKQALDRGRPNFNPIIHV